MTKLKQLRLGLVVCSSLALPAIAAAQQAHTTWYLAEGNVGFFEEEIAAVNPTSQIANGTVKVLRNGAAPVSIPFSVPPLRRVTVRVGDYLGASAGDVSAIIDTSTASGGSGTPIFVERSMYWHNRDAGSNAAALQQPSQTWYLAEGAANSFFDTFILLANPNTTAANVTLSLQKDDGTVFPVTATVPASSRSTIYVNQLQGFGTGSFSTVVNSDQPIFVERSMYWQGFRGGSDVAAVTAPSATWWFAEGFTGGDFKTFFLLSNPNGTDVTVTLKFYLDSGGVVTKTETVLAHSRKTVQVNDYPDMVGQAFATNITSTAPIVAERSTYWGGFKEGDATAGLATPSGSYAFAQGAAGTVGGINYETFFLFLNSSDASIDVRGTFYREDGFGTVQTITIPAHARLTLFGASVPGMLNERFGAFFEAVTSGQTFVVERAIYWNTRGGGTVTMGTPWNDTVTAPPAVPVTPPGPPSPPPPPPPSSYPWMACGNTPGTALVACVKATIGAGSGSSEAAFEVTKRVAWLLKDQGVGLLIKNGGDNVVNWNGINFSASRVCYPDGHIYKVMGDAGGANNPEFIDNAFVAPSLYVPAIDPGS